MRNVLQINKPDNSSHILWRHFTKSILLFCATYLILFLLPALSRRSRFTSKEKEEHYKQASDWIDYLSDNPIIPVVVCLVVVMSFNIFLYIKNNQKKFVNNISISDTIISMSRTNKYFNEEELISISTQNLECLIGVKTKHGERIRYNVKFIDKTKNELIALLPLRDTPWFGQYSEIQEALLKLDKQGVSHQEKDIEFWDSLREVLEPRYKNKRA